MRLLPVLVLVLMLGGTVANARMIGDDYTKLAEIQQVSGNMSRWLTNSSMADLLNASIGNAPKISSGSYESTKYDIPLGPYKVSFELRSPLNFFGAQYFKDNDSIGSGKDFHTAHYDVYYMASGKVIDVDEHADGTNNYDDTVDPAILETNNYDSNSATDDPVQIVPKRVFQFHMYIAHYTGPTKFQATEPAELWASLFKVTGGWDSGDENTLTIDGKKGVTWTDFGKDRNHHDINIIQYDLDPETYVVIMAYGAWDEAKDLSLFKETLHVSAEGI
jgi:hypothetical protein